MINEVVLTGRLTIEPELKNTNSGVAYTSFQIAVDKNVKKGDEKKANFIAGYGEQADPYRQADRNGRREVQGTAQAVGSGLQDRSGQHEGYCGGDRTDV